MILNRRPDYRDPFIHARSLCVCGPFLSLFTHSQESKALAPNNNHNNTNNNSSICMASSKPTNSSSSCTNASIVEDIIGESEEIPILAGNQSEEFDDVVKSFSSNNSDRATAGNVNPGTGAAAGSKTVGGWPKERKEQKKEESSRSAVSVLAATKTDAAEASAIAAAAGSKTVGGWPKERKEQKKEESSRSAVSVLAATKTDAAEASAIAAAAGSKTVGGWPKERKEQKKEESSRSAFSVLAATKTDAAEASAIAAASVKNEQGSKTDLAEASAATAVKNKQAAKTGVAVASASTATASVKNEQASKTGAAVASASTATAAVKNEQASKTGAAVASASTATAAVKNEQAAKTDGAVAYAAAASVSSAAATANADPLGTSLSGKLWIDDSSGPSNEDSLARGSKLRQRTGEGDPCEKIVSVYIDGTGKVMLEMKSNHGIFSKITKNVVLEVCKDVPAWTRQDLLDGEEQRRYFGLKTKKRGVVEFECKNQGEYELWTTGVSRLLLLAALEKNRR